MLKLLQIPFQKTILQNKKLTQKQQKQQKQERQPNNKSDLSVESNMEKNLPSYLQLSKPQLLQKFHEIRLLEDERIHDATVKQSQSKWSVNEGIKGFELRRNRYTNILPYDLTRVKLQVAKNSGFSDYINANCINLNLSNQWDKSCKEANYISTQGPTSTTTSHFWQMVMQSTKEKDVVVCMVTPIQEYGISKCFKYWCDKKDDYTIFNKDNDGFINHLRLKCMEDITTTDIKGVYYTKLKLQSYIPKSHEILQEKIIHHLYYDQWTDFSKPDDWKSIYQLTQRARELNHPKNPIIVHCSAGVGRTGTFITLDYLFNCVSQYFPQTKEQEDEQQEQQEQQDLIELIVLLLRTQRMMMVQSEEQYLFIYESLKQFLLSV